MSTLPWLPVILLLIISAAIPISWWAAIDRHRWLLVRAYHRYRPGARERSDIRWAHSLLDMEPHGWEEPEWECDRADFYDYDEGDDEWVTRGPSIETRWPRADLL